MCRKLICLVSFILVLATSAALHADVFSDDFETPHDYVVDGVAGTGWDGFVGLDVNETANAINASVDREGLLYLESVGAIYHEDWNPLGPFVYKVVEGDFVATVKVADYAGDPNALVFHNNCGLMARNVLDVDAGDGEDWVSIDYFPIWSCGNFVRSADDGARTEHCHNGLQWNLYPYLQLERKGNTFHFRGSPDGENWAEMACSPLEREDFDGLPVAVGLFHATYSDAVGYAAFDDFTVETPMLSDDFETPRDYLVEGVEGSLWDGLVGLDPNETANAISASVDREGQLYLESAGAIYHEPWNPLGPFLYTVVEGSFIATVKVTDYAGDPNTLVFHNTCGLMARNVLDTDAGEGEDWISIDYFPIWSCGNFVRSANDGARTEHCHNGLQWDLYPYLQLERRGNTFHLRASPDGENWEEMACSPLERDDFDGVPVAVGLFHATYSDDVGYAAFDDFSIEILSLTKAQLISPEDGAVVTEAPVLEWMAGDKAIARAIYFGTDPNNLELVATQEETVFVPEIDIEAGVVYYWRVDEIEADGTIQAGDVWSFVGGGISEGALFAVTDGFETAHDFLAQGVEGTFWDGFVGLDVNETANAINASVDREGLLYLESVGAIYHEDWNPLGPFLYKVVEGDFVATVKVTDYAGDPNALVFHNNCGLMARNVLDVDAGDGEDWVSIDYFPIWSCGNFVRSADDGARSENCHNGLQWDLYPYLQLERKGNTFHFRVSPDGENWEEMACSPVEREDFNDLPVAVGLFHATYSDDVGYAAFDDFTLETPRFSDDFETPRDYLVEGVEGSPWDGLVGLDVNETANAINASIDHAGQLYLESVGAIYHEDWNPIGPFLYKVVEGNFVATVKVTDYAGDPNTPVFHNTCGLMARNVLDADAGEGEDWVSIDYFPIWSCGNFVRTANDGARTENCHNGLQWDLYPYLQLERNGNTFHLRVSPDGESWEEMACSPVEREDFDGLPVAVGLFHATYSDEVGYAAFDDFSIETY